MTDWDKAHLGDLAEITMGQSPKGSDVNVTGIGLPLLNGPREFGPQHPVPVQWANRWSKEAVKGDLLFCVRGSTTGRMNWADQNYAIGRGLASVRGATPADTQFARAAVETDLARLLLQATGSTFPNVSREQLSAIPVLLPSPAERQRIAGVLGAFDDLIETNRRTAAALAQLTALAFRQATRDQPETSLGQLLSMAYGKALPAPKRRPGPIPIVSSAGITGSHEKALVSGPGVVVGRKGTVGSVTWVPSDFYPIDTVFYAESDLPPGIVYHLLASAGLADLNSDSAVPGLNRDRALAQPCPDVRGPIAGSIQGWLTPLMSGADGLLAEADDLAHQRDELLPLLMSGKVRVSDVEGVV